MKRSSLLDDLSKFPWWVSAGLAVVGFVSLRFILPAMEMQSQIGKALQMALPNFAWILALFLLVPAVMSAFREWESRKVAGKSKSNLAPKKSAKASKPSHRKEVIDMLMEELPPSGSIVGSQTNEKPTEWTKVLLDQLEWKRFEELCRAYFEAKGFTSKTTEVGADGGVDIKLYKGKSEKPAVLVQCKAWKSSVGVQLVRELFGVMAAEEVSQGAFMITGEFSPAAKKFAKGKKLVLASGMSLFQSIQSMSEEDQETLLKVATEGDYTTPTCVSCDIKMKLRTSKKGKNIGSKFWGCSNFPRCKKQLKYV